MVRVQLPDGCFGLDLPDGSRYSAKPGGIVDVAGTHADQINHSYYASAGIMRGVEAHHLGTRAGRWCRPCNRLWQAWTHTCHRCGTPTVQETR